MKILWASHRDIKNNKAGGSERVIYEVSRRLALRGHQITWLTGGWNGAKASEDIDGIMIRRYRGRIAPHLALPVVANHRTDFDVIVDDLSHAVPWFSPILTSIPGIAHFYHLHEKTLPGQVSFTLSKIISKMERLYPLIYKNWPFITISEDSKNDLIELGIDKNRISVIFPGVDTDLFKPGNKTPTPQLVYFGGMRPYKRPEHAIYALDKLIRKGISASLVMIGDGPSLPVLEKTVREMGLDSKVKFTGKVSDEDLAAIVRESWINIHCSVSEGWCLSAMEAAATGIPTVAYRVPGISNSVVDNQTGLLAADDDLMMLSDLVMETIKSSHERFSMNCRKHAMKYSWAKTATEWEAKLKTASELA